MHTSTYALQNAQFFPSLATFGCRPEREFPTLPPHVLSPAAMFRETLKGACMLLHTQAHLVSQDVLMAARRSLTRIPTPVAMQAHRFHLLDALRGLAAMLVVLYHSPLELQARFHFPNTYLAVDFFFCLSGFVIAYSYGDKLQAGMRLRDFAVVRLLRLYPLFALSVACAALRTFISPLKLHDVHSASELGALILTSFMLVPNFFVGGLGAELFPLNVPAWSLFLELIANAGFALCLRNARPVRLLVSLGALFTMLLCKAAYAAGTLDAGAEWRGFGLGLARVGFSFTAGVLVFSLYRRQGMRRWSPSLSLAAALAAVSAFAASLTISNRFTVNTLYPLIAATLIFPSLVYVGAHCAIPLSLHELCAMLGNVSYPLYILHVPLMLPYHNLLALPVLAAHPRALPYLPFLDLAILIPFCLFSSRLELPVRRRLTTAYRNAWQPSHLQEAPLTPRL